MSMFDSSPDSGRAVNSGLPRQPLGTIIFQKGLLTAEQLLEALEEGHRSHRRLGDILLERGWLDERDLAQALSEQYGLPAVELEPDGVDRSLADLLPTSDWERLGAVAVARDEGTLVVAVADPANGPALDELAARLGEPVSFVVAPGALIAAARLGLEATGDGRRLEAVPDEPVRADVAPEPQASSGEESASDWPPLSFGAEPNANGSAGDATAPPAVDEHVDEPGEPTDAFGWSPFVAAEAPAEEGPAEPATYSPWPEDVAAREHSIEPAYQPVFEAASVPAQAEELDAALPETAEASEAEQPAHEHVDEPPPAVEFPARAALVLRLSSGESVRIGDFEDSASARMRAEELVQQLRADGPAGWTVVDGRYFRPEAIIALDVVPAD